MDIGQKIFLTGLFFFAIGIALDSTDQDREHFYLKFRGASMLTMVLGVLAWIWV